MHCRRRDERLARVRVLAPQDLFGLCLVALFGSASLQVRVSAFARESNR
jgi:hypothetical protein